MTTSKRWGGRFRVIRRETVGGSVTFMAQGHDLLWAWFPVGFGTPGSMRFWFDTQSEVETQLDKLVAEIQAEKAAKKMRRAKSVKVVAR